MVNNKYTKFISKITQIEILLKIYTWVAVFMLLGISSPVTGQLQAWKAGSFTFRRVLDDVKLGKIPPGIAQEQFVRQWLEFTQLLPPDTLEMRLVFPLWQRNVNAVGGKGRGYRPHGFDLFDRTVSGSHPAQDIFIWDRNKDGREDQQGIFWPVLAVRAGVVVDNNTQWDSTSTDRGGRYVWLYDAGTGGLWYYAHLQEVWVVPGQWLEAGQAIGTLGRTGKNAWAKRSDTHLHLMYLELDSNQNVRPKNPFDWLKEAHTAKEFSLPAQDRAFFISALPISTPGIRLHTPTQPRALPTIDQPPIKVQRLQGTINEFRSRAR